jgi:GntR family transcriptional regulator
VKKHLDRSSFVPLYEQIHRSLREMIVAGKVAPGKPVPSERELSEHFSVSRMTARQALRALRQDGLAYLERGLGTFVAKRKVDVHTRNLAGFTEDMLQRGLQPSSRVVRLKRETPTQTKLDDLGLKAGAEVFRLERLRLADGTPMAYEINFIPATLCPDLDQRDLANDSLYRILGEEYGVRFQRAEEVLEAACATVTEARHLSIKPNAPLLVVHRIMYSETNHPIESVKTIYRADRYRATFHITKTSL